MTSKAATSNLCISVALEVPPHFISGTEEVSQAVPNLDIAWCACSCQPSWDGHWSRMEQPLQMFLLEQSKSSSLLKAMEMHPSCADGEASDSFDVGKGRVSFAKRAELLIQAFCVHLPKKGRKNKRKILFFFYFLFCRLVEVYKASLIPFKLGKQNEKYPENSKTPPAGLFLTLDAFKSVLLLYSLLV